MAKENIARVCKYCGEKFDGNFKLRGLTIICPHCDRPQPTNGRADKMISRSESHVQILQIKNKIKEE